MVYCMRWSLVCLSQKSWHIFPVCNGWSCGFRKVKRAQVRQSISIHQGVQDRNWCQSCSKWLLVQAFTLSLEQLLARANIEVKCGTYSPSTAGMNLSGSCQCLGSQWRLPISMPSLDSPQRTEEGIQHTCQYLLFQQNASFNAICSRSEYAQRFEVVTLTSGFIN